MRKVMVFALFTLFTALMFSTTVSAWDDLLQLTKGAGIGDVGTAIGTLGLRYTTAGDMYDMDSEKQSLTDDATGIRVPINVNYNVIENLRAFAIVPIVSTDNGVDSESGIGDIWLGAKYAVMPEGVLTVRGALDIPTGDDEKGLGNAGGFGIDIAALSRKSIIEDKLTAQGQLGIRYNAEDSDTKWTPGLAFYVGGTTRYDSEKLIGFVALTYFNQGDGEADGTEIKDSTVNWLLLEIGGFHRITEDLWVGPFVDYSLTGTNTAADLGINLRVWYNIMN
ncbi:transporter [Candidatus Latescibacterota bacterium]